MANIYPNYEKTPANTDDALEGPQRIREIKQAFNERLSRDHFFDASDTTTTPTTLAQGADSSDSGYHRRITIKEEQSSQAANADTRLNASSSGINASTDAANKMAEIWVEKHTGTGNETSMLFIGTEGSGNQRTVTTNTQTQTLTNKTLTAPIINDPTLSGGSGGIDGVPIGQRAYAAAETDPVVAEIPAGAAAGKFTTLESVGDTTIGDADTDTLTLKAKTAGLSSDATGGFTGANKMYAGMVGEIRMFAGSAEPEGWIFCDGRQVVHTGTGNYSELYDAIGLAFTDVSSIDGSVYGATGNRRSSADYFRIPNLSGRIPVGKGTGSQTNVAGDDGPVTDLKADALTARTLGDYGAAEDHTLTAGESGAGPHYHPVHLVDPGHDHTLEDIGQDYHTPQNDYSIGKDRNNDNPFDSVNVTSETTGITIKANHPLDVAGTTETVAQGSDSDDVFRTAKTNLNTGVPAVSGHTQMQPFVVINYIIKY